MIHRIEASVLVPGRGEPIPDGCVVLDGAVRAGLTALEAIEAATAVGPDTLGPQAPQSGLLEVGYDADVIAVSADPIADVSVLSDPANVTHVWKSGDLVKSPAQIMHN